MAIFTIIKEIPFLINDKLSMKINVELNRDWYIFASQHNYLEATPEEAGRITREFNLKIEQRVKELENIGSINLSKP